MEDLKSYSKKDLKGFFVDIGFIISMCVLMFFINEFLNFIFQNISLIRDNFVGASLLKENLIMKIVLGCVLAPFIESFFIIFIINILGKFIKSKFLCTLITTLIFAGVHYYSIPYIIMIIPIGGVLVFSYSYYKGKVLSSFWILTLIHILYNLIMVLL